ncbi:MAG: YihY family inner membrane protein [Burkholderiales bacterium]
MNRQTTHTSPSEEVSRALQALQNWPWLETVRILRQRFREDRLGLTASSLTFTTIMALVPLVTVALALFSAFPMFGRFQDSLQRYFLQSLVPSSIVQPVMQGLTSFAEQAAKVGSLGLAFLVITALALMATIDRALNAIWRVPRMRSFGRRVLIYWGATTLLPLALGVGLSATSLAISASRGLIGGLPGGVGLLFDVLAFALLGAAMTAMYHFVPNTHVRWRHAIAGGLFVAVAFECAKRALAWYLLRVPGYSLVYGAFATVPIFLLWTYMSWLIVLFGAVIAAYAPSLQSRMRPLQDSPGARFGLAVAMLRELISARDQPGHGLSSEQLWSKLRIDPLQVEPLLDTLVDLDWVGRLDEAGTPRYVLLCDPASTQARPLLVQLLLQASPAIQGFWRRADFDAVTLADIVAP